MSQIAPRPTHPTRAKPGMLRLAGVLIIIVMVAGGAWGLIVRARAHTDLKATTEREAVTGVVLVKAMHGPKSEDLVLPGNVQAFVDAPIFARTSGYIKAWYTDIGAQVTKGQLLAEIDTPEVDDQLRQAQADLATAEANSKLAISTAKRWQALVATNSVSRQENDEKVADAAAKDAVVAASRANVARLEQLESFKRVVAPFDGVVTARRTDVGALINAGSGVGPELFRVADTNKLRIYIQVPQAYAPMISIGMIASLRFIEHPKRDFAATVVRTAEAIDPLARTLLVELQFNNEKHELLPGGYTEAHLAVAPSGSTVRLPINTLLFRSEGLRVAKVDATNHIVLAPLTLGRDFGTSVEVVDGVAPDEPVVLNPPNSIKDGQEVRIVQAPSDKGSASVAEK